MKTYCVAFIVFGSLAIAAEAPQDLTFKSTPIGLPPLELLRPGAFLGAPIAAGPDRSTYYPPASTDLIAPSSTRQIIIRDFQVRQHAPKINESAAYIRHQPTIVYPAAATDLIGRKADRDKLIKEFHARIEK